MSDLRSQFLALLGDAPTGGSIQPDPTPAQASQPSQPAGPPPGVTYSQAQVDALLAARSSAQQAPPTVASIVNRPSPNPVSDYGGPGMTSSLMSDDQPVWKWSEAQVSRFVEQKGYREFVSLMKRRLPNDLRGQRFHFPRS